MVAQLLQILQFQIALQALAVMLYLVALDYVASRGMQLLLLKQN